MIMTLDEIFAHGAKAARTLFAASGEVQPMWIAQTKEGEIIPIIAPMPDPDSKDYVIAMVKGIFEDKDVVRYVSLMEAWILELKDKPIPESFRLGAPISQHPDRREVIALAAEDKVEGMLTGMFYILRPEHGKATLSPLKTMDKSTTHAGRFVGLLA